MNRRERRSILAVVLVLVACWPAPFRAQTSAPSPDSAEHAMRAIAAWLEAEDFDADRLESLARLGPAVVPSLAAALRSGPSPARRELVRRALETEHGALASNARADPERRVRSRDEFLRHYLSNFETRYRIRAAQALGAIGGPSARQALESALEAPVREELRDALRRALERIR
jgi:HEAT repeat protein